jgi:hypothetical protein
LTAPYGLGEGAPELAKAKAIGTIVAPGACVELHGPPVGVVEGAVEGPLGFEGVS